MITLNKKNNFFTFQAICTKTLPTFKNINKEHLTITTLLEQEKSYLYFDQAKTLKKEVFIQVLNHLTQKAKRAYSIDLESFHQVTKFSYSELIYIFVTSFGVFNQNAIWMKQKPEKCFTHNISAKNDLQEAFNNANIIAEAMIKTRNLQELPFNHLNAVNFAKKIIHDASKINNLRMRVLTKKQIENKQMGLLLAVNQGSTIEPRVVVLEYQGNPKSDQNTVIVGKGITYDTGGYNLKPGNYMQHMKFDMSGAAIACQSLIAIAKLKLKTNFTAIAMLTDSSITGDAFRADDIITSMSGKTVEIVNTDAEGRLVLADGVTYAHKITKPTAIITVATLTGAILVALGEQYTGVFSDNEKLYNEFNQASIQAKELIWRMPLAKEFHLKAIHKSKNADVYQACTPYSGSSLAAAFMWEFAQSTPFLHLDIAGSSTIRKNYATACMVKTFVELARIKQ